MMATSSLRHNRLAQPVTASQTMIKRRASAPRSATTQSPHTDDLTFAPVSQRSTTQSRVVTTHRPGGWRVALLLCLGGLLLLALYTIVFWIGVGGISAYNRVVYSATYTTNLDTEIAGQAAHVTAVNDGGTILVTIYQPNQAPSFKGPALAPATWGDLDGITVDLTVVPTQNSVYPTIIANLTGLPDFWHPFFYRPHGEFKLVPNARGVYSVS